MSAQITSGSTRIRLPFQGLTRNRVFFLWVIDNLKETSTNPFSERGPQKDTLTFKGTDFFYLKGNIPYNKKAFVESYAEDFINAKGGNSQNLLPQELHHSIVKSAYSNEKTALTMFTSYDYNRYLTRSELAEVLKIPSLPRLVAGNNQEIELAGIRTSRIRKCHSIRNAH